MDLRLHCLEALGTLAPWREQFQKETTAVAKRIDTLVPQSRGHAVDVVVRRSDYTIPELGIMGSCFETGLVTIELSPANPAFERSLAEGEFAATLAHELHHSLRHAGPGYGLTLGEALVSEGLADRFAVEAMGGGQPIYTQAPDREELLRLLQRAEAQLAASDYDHRTWFFGSGDLPRWAGYALGWLIVSRFLSIHPTASAASLVHEEAQRVLDAIRPLRDLQCD